MVSLHRLPNGVADTGELIDQWAEFTADLEKGCSFDLDNWLNDVDARATSGSADVQPARKWGDHALKLDQADAAFRYRDARLKEVGQRAPRQKM